MSRLGEWWRNAKLQPQAHPTEPGHATVPYPSLDRSDRTPFARCEQYLLREVVDARAWGRQVAGRDDAPDTNGWLVMPGRTYSSLLDDTKGMGATPAMMDAVVDWLAGVGALRSLPARTREAIASSNVAERLRDYPEYHRDEDDARRAWDDDIWEVEPTRMLQVYPLLAGANDDWSRTARR